jgi:hypothetical protein
MRPLADDNTKQSCLIISYCAIAYYWLIINIVTFSEKEKNMVEEVFNNAIDTLSDEDKQLPQVLYPTFSGHINVCTVSRKW